MVWHVLGAHGFNAVTFAVALDVAEALGLTPLSSVITTVIALPKSPD